jgi:uncharacterized membrane protein YbhN (UPF0104 family)
VLGWALRAALLALLAFLALRLRDLWRDSPVDLASANVVLLSAAAVVSLAAVSAYGLVWPRILATLGHEPPARPLGLFLQSQLGKYVPGSVWQYAGRVGLARSRGVPARITVVSLAVEVGASVAAAAAVGLFVLPLVLAVPIALALVLVVALGRDRRISRRALAPLRHVVRRQSLVAREDLGVALRAVPRVAPLYVPVWLVYGAAFCLTARALTPIPVGDLVYLTAAFALGWIAGMVVVFAPGGIGVREAVLVALLAPRVGEAEAIVIAACSRILLTTADLAGGAGALALDRLAMRRRRAEGG